MIAIAIKSKTSKKSNIKMADFKYFDIFYYEKEKKRKYSIVPIMNLSFLS